MSQGFFKSDVVHEQDQSSAQKELLDWNESEQPDWIHSSVTFQSSTESTFQVWLVIWVKCSKCQIN